jgi:hypothetical protein
VARIPASSRFLSFARLLSLALHPRFFALEIEARVTGISLFAAFVTTI